MIYNYGSHMMMRDLSHHLYNKLELEREQSILKANSFGSYESVFKEIGGGYKIIFEVTFPL